MDSAAGILICLVVFGHAIAPLDSRVVETVEQWLYMFHMPAFVFVSGYLTRYSRTWSPLRLVLRLGFPYVVFSVIHALELAALTGEPVSVTLLSPEWTLWYLLALLAWRLAAPLLRVDQWMVIVTVLVALIAGVFPILDTTLSAQRIFGFAPFFTLGLVWKDQWWRYVRNWPVRFAALAAFAGAFVWSWFTEDEVSRRIFFLHVGYEDLGHPEWYGMIVRFLVITVGGLLALGLLSWMSSSYKLMTGIGAATLPVYLLHPLFLYPGREDGYHFPFDDTMALVVLALASCLFAYVFSRPFMVALVRPFMDYTFWRDLGRRAVGRRRQEAPQDADTP